MKIIFIKNLTAVLVVLCVLFCFACGDNQTADKVKAEKEVATEAAKAHGEEAAYTAAYICPMHCEGSGSDKAGVCPVCGMDYEALVDHTKNGHTH